MNNELKIKSSNNLSPVTTENSEIETNIFDEYLKTDFDPADGFDFPVDDFGETAGDAGKASDRRYQGWKIAEGNLEKDNFDIHAEEDWKDVNNARFDLGQNVFSTADGMVIFAGNSGKSAGNLVIIQHIFYENNRKRNIQSVYANLLEVKVKKDEKVKRRQIIGSIGQDTEKKFPPHLHFELKLDKNFPSGDSSPADINHPSSPIEFINEHRKLFVPQNEPTLVLVDQTSYKTRLYKSGKFQGEYEVSFGQSKGAKQLRGDNKTPVGMYFVIQKHRGRFDGEYGAYYGGHWIKVNYPNKYDAARGLAEKMINARQAGEISSNWNKRLPTLQNTKLGGGIGFHGWIREWENGGSRHLSWGCVVMHIYDISRLYDQIPEGAMVVIF